MDIVLAKSFLTVAETGSFIDAARRLNVTQSTMSARINSLETLLGRELFERSKSGAALTTAGHQFRKHALALVRVWQQARLEVGLAGEHRDRLSVGAELGLWEFLLPWVGSLRQSIPELAVTGAVADPTELMQRLAEGTLDLAVTYRPGKPPGLVVEHLFDEEFVLVAGTRPGKRGQGELVRIEWGPHVQTGTETAPELPSSGLTLDLASLALDYVLAGDAMGHFPVRLVAGHVKRGRLKLVRKGRRFMAPVGMVYPENRDESAFEPVLDALRGLAAREATSL